MGQNTKRLAFLLIAILALGGCNKTFWKKDGVRAADQAPAPHESWCYRSLAKIDCYTEPQPGMYDRLVNVDPASRFPASAEDYAKNFAKPEDPTTPRPPPMPLMPLKTR